MHEITHLFKIFATNDVVLTNKKKHFKPANDKFLGNLFAILLVFASYLILSRVQPYRQNFHS